MDQKFFAGVGNIYRAEILFKAGVHPEVKGIALSRAQFEAVWRHSVLLMQRGFFTGSILSVDPDEAAALGDLTRRRHIYNQSACFRCGGECSRPVL
jgi:formamidopyrimidine-DNA glycosylase